MSSVPTVLHGADESLMPLGRVLRAYATEIRFESVRMLRAAGFAIPFLLLPVPVYLFFGVMLAGPAVAGNPELADYLFSGFSVLAVMGPALFGVGCALAVERDAGLLKLKRALPAPTGAYLVAKMTMALVTAAVALSLLAAVAGAAGRVTLSPGQMASLLGVLALGSIPFAAMGLFIGAHVSGSSAPALINIVYLPMLWLSGLFIPLPKVLEPWAVIWPAFHLNQVALAAAAVTEFRFVPPLLSAAVLFGVTVVFGGLAIRRLQLRG